MTSSRDPSGKSKVAVEMSGYTPMVTFTNRYGIELTLQGSRTRRGRKLHIIDPGPGAGYGGAVVPQFAQGEATDEVCRRCVREATR